jgi:sugar lactone lactonase YvrE
MRVLPSGIRASGFVVSAFLFVLGSHGPAQAAKNHCRKIQLIGTAGTGNKPVIFYVKNQTGTVVLSRSCSITADDNETDFAYVKRMPFAWGQYPSNCPNPNPGLSGYDPADPLTQRCINYAGGSCKLKFKVSPKDTGAKKKYAEICCFEEADCGVKLGTTDPTPIPITVQVEKEGSSLLCPKQNNCDDCALCEVSPDPIGVVQLPSPVAAKCRDSLNSAVIAYINGAAKELVGCHRARMAGKIPPGADCNSVATPDAGVAAAVAQLAAGITEATSSCAAERSPTTLGYDSCPAPCDGIDVGGCSAGIVSPTCETDRDCDTAPGSGDGRCGNWSQVGACLTCVAENTVETAVSDVYGTPSVPLPEDTQACQHAIGDALLDLLRVSLGTTANCQKKLDGGKLVLPAGVDACDNYDPTGKVSDAEAKITEIIGLRCDAAMIAMLDAICTGAITPADVAMCTITHGDDATEQALAATVPSSANACGDNEQQGFEHCDGIDDALCPGQCQIGCTCPPPVCGNNVVEIGELCDGSNDAACPGTCLSSCLCPPPLFSPATEDLTPCDPTVLDRYTFEVAAGESVVVRADTIDGMTAADLCFDVRSGCDTGDMLVADEEVPCSIPSPTGDLCPQASIAPLVDGICTVEVTECSQDCADPSIASYRLFVTRNGYDTELQFVADDTPPPCTLLTKWGSLGGGAGQFSLPHGVTVDTSGNVYVTDPGNQRIQKFTNEGIFLGAWGSAGTGDGQFAFPYAIAVDGTGSSVYVAEIDNHRVQKFTSSGSFLTKWGSLGSGDGQFNQPIGVAVDANGDVFVADDDNARIQKFTSTGGFLTKWGTLGASDGQFDGPWAIAVDASGDVYVNDVRNYRVQKFTNTGAFLTKWGSFGDGYGEFVLPIGIAVDGTGGTYVLDYVGPAQKYTNTGAYVTKWGREGSDDGEFQNPVGIAVDAGGSIFVADTQNHRIQKFDCSP